MNKISSDRKQWKNWNAKLRAIFDPCYVRSLRMREYEERETYMMSSGRFITTKHMCAAVQFRSDQWKDISLVYEWKNESDDAMSVGVTGWEKQTTFSPCLATLLHDISYIRCASLEIMWWNTTKWNIYIFNLFPLFNSIN